MLRTRPCDDDTLFQVGFATTSPVDDLPVGPRHCATFAQNQIEAVNLVRHQFGVENAGHVQVIEVFTREREKNGTLHTIYLYPERRRETIVPDDLADAA